MNILEFGDAKLLAEDVDPLYIALHQAQLPLSVRRRFTLAEVAYDDAGIAAQIASAPSKQFWERMAAAASEKKRGSPRRYFFPTVALSWIDWARGRYGTGEMAVASLAGMFADVKREMKPWNGWGPCAMFKLADMAERVCHNQIDFSAVGEREICSNGQVKKGWDKAAASLHVKPSELLDRLRAHNWATEAPPDYYRSLNAQEWESIVCYYSHDDKTSKHLPGMDRIGIIKELMTAPKSKLAKQLIDILNQIGDGI